MEEVLNKLNDSLVDKYDPFTEKAGSGKTLAPRVVARNIANLAITDFDGDLLISALKMAASVTQFANDLESQ